MRTSHIRPTALAVGCIALGAAGSTIVAAGAQSPTPSQAPAAKANPAKKKQQGGAVERAARRAVHAELTVATKDGFDEVVVDRGVVTRVTGAELTLQHRTRKRSGDSVTVRIPTDARVRVDRKAAKLSDLRAGQRVVVLQLPERTVVRATTR